MAFESALDNDMFQYFPKEENILTKDSGSRILKRFIFDGPTVFDESENNIINEIKALSLDKLSTENQKFLMSLKDSADIIFLRFYYECGKDIAKVPDRLKSYLNYLSEYQKTYESVLIDNEEIWKTNGFYCYGRDCCQRPIIIFNYEKICEALIEYSVEELEKSLFAFFQCIVESLLIPGQIENWVFLVDFKNLSEESSFLVESAVKILINSSIGNSTRQYRSYFLSPSASIKLQINKNFDEKNSFIIENEKDYHKIWEHVNQQQIELKYGGLALDFNQLDNWIPAYPNKNLIQAGD